MSTTTTATATSQMQTKSDLLTERLIGVRVGSETEMVSLPGLLSILGAGKDVVLTALQSYQEHAVFSFLVYLAAVVLHKSKVTDTAQTRKWWSDGLEELVGGPWPLIEGDFSKPGFFQPPTSPSILEEGKKCLTPDDLDVIPNAANHSRKKHQMVAASLEHWFYALVSMQGNAMPVSNYFGSVRSSSSGRVYVTITPSMSLGEQFVRDVGIALAERHNIVKTFEYKNRGGMALPWLRPWNGNEPSLGASDLDPFFLDVPRLARLRVDSNGRLVAYKRETPTHHIEIGSCGGDPWTPLRRKDSKGMGLTLDKNQFSLTTSYEKIHGLVFDHGKTILPASVTHRFEGDGYLIVGGIVFDKGKTCGYHRRVIPVESRYVAEITTPKLANFSSEHVEVAAGAVKHLERAVTALIMGETKSKMPPSVQSQHRVIMATFESVLDDQFFEHLFKRLDGETVRPWFNFVMQSARNTVEAASRTACRWVGRHFQSMALATHILDNYETSQRARDNHDEGEDPMPTEPTTYDQLHLVINRVHNYLMSLSNRDRGALARLRSMSVEAPMVAEFFDIERSCIDPAKAELPTVHGSETEVNRRWTTIVKLAALSTELHCKTSTGHALANAGLSRLRFERLLKAQDRDNLHGLMDSTVRFLSQKRTDFCLTDLAYLYLWPKSSDADVIRRRVAKDYYTSN